MQRYLFRVTYTLSDGTLTYESVCVRSETADAALAEVEAWTERYRAVVGAVRSITSVLVTADA